MNPKVDFYFDEAQKWQSELEQLRHIVLDCGLTEDLKWGVPCYMFQQGNVVLIHAFKDYCAVLFFKGALLNDTDGVLIQQTENVQAARQMRFNSFEAIIAAKTTLKTYLYEAIEIEKAGLKVPLKPATDFAVPKEFQDKLDTNSTLKAAFEALTPGRQRAYNLFFAAAKQPKTREARVESYVQQIINGKGLNDCTCGLSKRQPNCDGSHKYAR
jgi:uncharacterized protein YdeI (YjbR/CyaY-like superfamily)